MKKTILIALFLYLVGFVQARETPEIPTNTTAIESYDMPGYFLVCTTSSGAAQMIQDGDQIPEGQWNIVEGLTGTDTITFAPAALENHYMRHRGFVLYCDPTETGNLYLNDASFVPVPGLADPTCISFESVNYPGRYLQHNDAIPMGLVLEPVGAGNEGAATFRFPVEIVTEPVPADGSIDIPVEGVILRWPMVPNAQAYLLYFGTSLEDVEGATINDPCGTNIYFQFQDNFYSLNTLGKQQTYYWRVDAFFNEVLDIIRGDIWSFSTTSKWIIDDFESYTNNIDAGEAIFQTWIDGWGNPYNGAWVGYMEAPFAERDIVSEGKQSLPLWYDNIDGFAWADMSWQDYWDWLIQLGYEEPNEIASEATRFFDEPMDWISEDFEYRYLVLYVRGNTGNTGGTLYTKINDAVIWNTDPNVLATPLWASWIIDFNDIETDLNEVRSLTIGVAGLDYGVFFIDEIGLYQTSPESIEP